MSSVRWRGHRERWGAFARAAGSKKIISSVAVGLAAALPQATRCRAAAPPQAPKDVLYGGCRVFTLADTRWYDGFEILAYLGAQRLLLGRQLEMHPALAQRPVHTGARFSVKASGPSIESWLWTTFCTHSASMR